jgi:hypothetical protein
MREKLLDENSRTFTAKAIEVLSRDPVRVSPSVLSRHRCRTQQENLPGEELSAGSSSLAIPNRK